MIDNILWKWRNNISEICANIFGYCSQIWGGIISATFDKRNWAVGQFIAHRHYQFHCTHVISDNFLNSGFWCAFQFQWNADLLCNAPNFLLIPVSAATALNVECSNRQCGLEVLLMTHKIVHRNCPPYLHDLITLVSSASSRSTRAHKFKLRIPFVGAEAPEASFTVKSCRLWNSLSEKLCANQNIDSFKQLVKTMLFKRYDEEYWIFPFSFYVFSWFCIYGCCYWGQRLPY